METASNKQTEVEIEELTDEDLVSYNSKHNKYLIHQDIDNELRDQMIEGFEADLVDATYSIIYGCFGVFMFILAIILCILTILYYTFENKYISINTALMLVLVTIFFRPVVTSIVASWIDFIYDKIAPRQVRVMYQYPVVKYEQYEGSERDIKKLNRQSRNNLKIPKNVGILSSNIMISRYNIINKQGEEINHINCLYGGGNSSEETFLLIGSELIKIGTNLKKTLINIANTPNLIEPATCTISNRPGNNMGDVIIVLPTKYYDSLHKIPSTEIGSD